MKKPNCSILRLLIVTSGILIFAIAFLPAVSYTNSESIFKGYELAVGTQFIGMGSWSSGQIEQNILIGIAYLLHFFACYLTVFLKRGAIISIILFLTSAILLSFIPELTVASITVLGNSTEIDVNWTMAYGLYLAIAISIIGAFLNVYLVASNPSKN